MYMLIEFTYGEKMLLPVNELTPDVALAMAYARKVTTTGYGRTEKVTTVTDTQDTVTIRFIHDDQVESITEVEDVLATQLKEKSKALAEKQTESYERYKEINALKQDVVVKDDTIKRLIGMLESLGVRLEPVPTPTDEPTTESITIPAG